MSFKLLVVTGIVLLASIAPAANRSGSFQHSDHATGVSHASGAHKKSHLSSGKHKKSRSSTRIHHAAKGKHRRQLHSHKATHTSGAHRFAKRSVASGTR